MARSTRARANQARGANPVDLRNALPKWCEDTPPAAAISARGVAPERSAISISFARRSCQGAGPPLIKCADGSSMLP